MDQNKITFIGFGNMGSAIYNGMQKSKLTNEVLIVDMDEKKLLDLKNTNVTFLNKIEEKISDSKLIWLCVKPQSFNEITKDLIKFCTNNQTLVSIMAGVTINQIKKETEMEKIVRVMPNTPAQISKGMSVWTNTKEVEKNDVDMVQNILNSIGKSVRVDSENEIELATALSGSGPGFIYKFIESMIKAGKKIGLSETLSRELVTETFFGSASLLEVSDKELEALKEDVTSPGGTTEAGLNFLDKMDIDNIVFKMINSAVNRSKELSKKIN